MAPRGTDAAARRRTRDEMVGEIKNALRTVAGVKTNELADCDAPVVEHVRGDSGHLHDGGQPRSLPGSWSLGISRLGERKED